MPQSRTTRERAQVIERAHANNRGGHDRARQRADQQLPPSHGDPPRSRGTPNTNDGTRVAPR
jgi:hypothetical protein